MYIYIKELFLFSFNCFNFSIGDILVIIVKARKDEHNTCFVFHFFVTEETREPYSTYKIGSLREDCPLLINTHKILSTSNVRLFFNTIPHVQASIFSGPYHGISSVGLIRLIIGSNTMKNFVDLTHLIKLAQ